MADKKANQFVKKTPEKKTGARSVYIYTLAAVAVAAGLYFIMAELKLFQPKPRTVESLMAAYKLYNDTDAKKQVVIFYGASDSEAFRSEKRGIFASAQEINQIKQCIILLCQGPLEEGRVSLLPEGSQLREAYLDPNNILYIDMSGEFSEKAPGGTTAEYRAVYSLLDTVFYNFKTIKGIKLLINGEERETVSGHISINEVLKSDTDFKDIKI